ncbi:MAG: pilus assembly protein TadG-related protein [Sphingomicrobium sp.]
MIQSIKRLWGNKRGNALIIMAGALPLVIGSAGLASDTIQWVLWKRQLQRAADSAALAGVYARFQSASATSAVTADLAKNNKLWVALLSGYPATTTPADTSSFQKQVQVSLAVQQSLGFSSVFLATAPTISVTARAAAIDDGIFCMDALAKTGSAITIGGSANVNLGCGAISNSGDATASVGTNGNSFNFTASPVAGVGGLPSSINGATDLQPYHLALPDPFAGLYPTDVPTGQTCYNNINATKYTGADGKTHVPAGCYNSFNPGNGETVLDAGQFYLNNTGLSTNGTTTITGTGVTVIFTGTNPGSLSMNGNSVINLTAPPTGTYAKMLFIQAANATAENSNTINGNNGSGFDGAMYFPNGNLTFTGSSSAATKCAMVVAWRIDMTGNTNMQNNTTGCTANRTVTGKKIRLVA